MVASASLAQGSSTVRLLVVTGDHEFDPSFWEIFKTSRAWKVERRAHEPTGACTVYYHPIAPDFDAALLYDMPRTVSLRNSV